MARVLTKRRLCLVAVFLGVTAVSWFYARAKHAQLMADPAHARREGLPIPVRTASVVEREFDQVIGATAVTIPSQTAAVQVGPNRDLNISAPLSPLVVKAVHVREGDRVCRGQLLLELDDVMVQQIVKQREEALAAAKATLERAQQMLLLNQKVRDLDVKSAEANVAFHHEDLTNRKRITEAMEGLMSGKAGRLFDYLDARTKLAQAQSDMIQAELRLQQTQTALQGGLLQDELEVTRARNLLEMADIDLTLARRNTESCRLTSPLDGLVDRIEFVPGQVVGIGALLTHVFQVNPIYLQVDVPQERMDDVFVGQKAEVTLDSFPQETFTGNVVRIGVQVNPQVRVLPVVVEVSNPNYRIRPGISGFVRLHATRAAKVIPPQAVFQQGNKAFTFCVRDSRARLREVHTGSLLQTGALEVRDGLASGEDVVIFDNYYRHVDDLARGNGYLQDNDLVDTDWRKWTHRD